MPASDDVLTIPRTGPERAAATSSEGAAPSSFRRVHVPRTKIVGTLGPASNSAEGVRALIEAGLDVARINFSHGTHEQHARTIATVREVAEQLGRPVAILGDLQGPRIRIGVLPEKRELEPGTSVVLVPEEIAAGDEIPITYADLCHDVSPGNRVLINDGLFELVVTKVEAPRVTATPSTPANMFRRDAITDALASHGMQSVVSAPNAGPVKVSVKAPAVMRRVGANTSACTSIVAAARAPT